MPKWNEVQNENQYCNSSRRRKQETDSVSSNYETKRKETLSHITEIRPLVEEGVNKDVRANCFCASSLHTQTHMPSHASSARVKY